MQVLVLNISYVPINVINLAKGFNLVFKGKAEILEYDKFNPIITENNNYHRPTVIRLLKYVPMPFRKVNISRDNIIKRDDFRCIYCDSKSNLTIDHLIPKSKGGQNTWENLVTCCHKCNVKKGNKTLNESNMKIKYKPFKPTYSLLVKKSKLIDESWINYLN